MLDRIHATGLKFDLTTPSGYPNDYAHNVGADVLDWL